MFKMKYVLLIVLLLSLVFIFNACGRKGELSINQLPVVEITSYSGVEDSLGVEDTISFQQKIYWSGYDHDGVVEGYAFRVIDESGNPIPTPWNDVIDENNGGWIYHYLPGADESIPLAETEARSIWTDQVYAMINFPANIDGDSLTTTSIFEIKCIDSDGGESEVVRKYYQVTSDKPICNTQSSKGDISGKETGTGIMLKFIIEEENEQFIEGDKADHFEFMFELVNLAGEVIIDDSLAAYGFNEWHSTAGLADVYSYFVCLDNEDGTKPALVINTAETDSTRIIAKAIDLAGIHSILDTTTFFVKDGFYPSTLIYNGITQANHGNSNDIFVLGDNHFTTYNPVSETIPNVLTSEGYHYSSPFWVDKNGDYACI